MIRPIVRYDDPVLRKPGATVAPGDPAARALAQDLVETLAATDTGIGLAAQQVGVAVRLCVLDLRGVERGFTYTLDGRVPPLDLCMPLVMANPAVRALDSVRSVAEEGCLSFPGLRGDVERPERIEVRFQDLEGGDHVLVCDGLLGRCVQHENDHLDGVLFIDRMERADRKRLDPELRALRKARA
jgi:peptide deformylase